MKFLGSTLVSHGRYIPGSQDISEHERLRRVVDAAVWAEGVGYDAFGVGERHNPSFLSSAPPVLLAHIAARTSRIRLVTTVTVLSLLDPVRAAEDYATLDHLSDGRLDLIIGKGNDEFAPLLFGATEAEQWDRLEESYELLRRLWRDEDVTWSGRFRPPLARATVRPRPFQSPGPRVWHGSATSTRSTDLAARHGDPLFSANGFQRTETYVRLVDDYRERLAVHGFDPADALVGVGAAAPVITARSQDAFDLVRPTFEAFRNSPGAAKNRFPFESVEDFAEHGSLLVGTAEQVTEKLLRFRELFGNEVLGIGVDSFLLSDPAAARGHLEHFFAEVAPVLRAEVPSRPWGALEAVPV